MKIRSSFTATLFLWRQTSGVASQQGHDWQHGVCAAGKHNRPCSQPEGKYQTPRGIKTSRDTWLTIQGKHTLSEVWIHCDNNHHDHGDRHLSSIIIIINHHKQPAPAAPPSTGAAGTNPCGRWGTLVELGHGKPSGLATKVINRPLLTCCHFERP